MARALSDRPGEIQRVQGEAGAGAGLSPGGAGAPGGAQQLPAPGGARLPVVQAPRSGRRAGLQVTPTGSGGPTEAGEVRKTGAGDVTDRDR